MLAILGGLLLAAQSPGLTLHGRVLGPDGTPLAAHVVAGCQAVIVDQPFEAAAAATRAGADGRFALELPSEWIERGPAYRELDVFAYLAGHGIVTRRWAVAEVLRFDGPAPAGIVVEVEELRIRGEEDGAQHLSELDWRAPFAGDEPFTVPAAAAHSVCLVSAGPEALALSVQPEDAGLVVTRPATYRVHGRAVSDADGRPVAGARFLVRAHHKGWVESDADGRFAFDCAWPGYQLGAVLAPPGFASIPFLDGLQGKKPDDGAAVDVGDVRLHPTTTATGVVRGPDGAPVAGAWVVGKTGVPQGRRTFVHSLSAVTDAEGRYALPGARLRAALELSVKLGERSAEALQSPERELELVLETRLRARGILRLVDGAPAAGVELAVWRASPPNMIGGEELVVFGDEQRLRSAADGSFASAGGLEPDARYCLVWSGERVEPGRSDWLTGAELDAGVELVLRGLGSVRGVVRRADGAPLAGVKVRARSSDAVQLTDASGAFELPNVPARGDVVIVHDLDGTPQVRWAVPGEKVDWQLLRAEQPLGRAPEHERGRELALASELLEGEYRAAVEAADESRLLRAVRSLAWADPALVLERVEAGLFATGWMREFALAYVADALLPESPAEALAVSMRIDRGMSRSLKMLEAAARLTAAEEREQLALIRAEARGIDPPEHRVVVLAYLADRLLDLGEDEAAADVLAEGRAVAAALPPEDWPGYARSRFGEVLARVDPAGGRALIDELAAPGDRPRHLLNTAHELAASDPAGAEALMAELAAAHAPWSPGAYCARIVHRMAPVDPERARKLAAKYDRTGFADGMLALALADADPAEARAALERAFARAEALSLQNLEWNERPVSVAAALLPVAERVAPARLRAYVARAVALRRPPAQERFGGDEVVWREEATLAFYLARFEPELARVLLEPAVEAASKLRGLELRSEYDAVWAAAAVVDPEWAAGVARALGGRAAQKVGLVLALPPVHRTEYCQAEIVDLWVVGQEDL